MTTFQTLRNELPSEMKKVNAIASSTKGYASLVSFYETQFNHECMKGCNVVYEIARVNVLRRLRGEKTLC